jgi:aryl-alcohol dehydrogenase-like predicted oxidoreductase
VVSKITGGRNVNTHMHCEVTHTHCEFTHWPALQDAGRREKVVVVSKITGGRNVNTHMHCEVTHTHCEFTHWPALQDAGRREKVVVASKITGGRNVSVRNIKHDCEQSLKRLGTDHLDVYLLHWPARNDNHNCLIFLLSYLNNSNLII